jgi:S-adenosylmethionine synthetase
MINAINDLRVLDTEPFDIINITGITHPTFIIERITNNIARIYDQYCKKNFDQTFERCFEKSILVGGGAKVNFGYSRMVKPMRLLVIGNAVSLVGSHKIPIEEVAREATNTVLSETLDTFDSQRDLIIENITRCPNSALYGSGENSEDAVEKNEFNASVYHTNPGIVSGIAQGLVSRFDSICFQELYPFIGAGVEVNCFRLWDDLRVNLRIPFKAKRCPNRLFYDEKIKSIGALFENTIQKKLEARGGERGIRVKVVVNEREAGGLTYLSHNCLDLDKGHAFLRARSSCNFFSSSRCLMPSRGGKTQRKGLKNSSDYVAKEVATAVRDKLGIHCAVKLVTQASSTVNEIVSLTVHVRRSENSASIQACERVAREMLANL